MPSICFIAMNTLPVLAPEYSENQIGGESVQVTLLAKAFRDIGYDVSLVERDYGQGDVFIIDDIKVLRAFKSGSGLPGIRSLHPKMTGRWRALSQANCDIYYQSSASLLTGVVCWFCRRRGKRFVFRLAHDTDAIPGKYIVKRPLLDGPIYEYGLKKAEIIYAQSIQQQDLLRQNYNLDSILMNMAVELPSSQEASLPKDIDVLWVNNMRPFKRPDLALDLASQNPDLNIVMIGGATAAYPNLFEEIQRGAVSIPNIDFKGAVPYDQVNEYYARAKVFINTSDTEGFPNSFLQSWIRGVPVLSFFDPDSIIQLKKLGETPRDIDDMAAQIRRLLNNPRELEMFSDRVRQFAFDNYAPQSIAKQYHESFLQKSS
ncbi:glycosyltransferase family 4 protein [Desulfovibrio inopinatus]|uniref:glycosyltransferase family 4 protein n=1 Tax=Desulfovibrio inopinatus TaxID=102109 RepID=UPI00040E874F|nr:glycosyltransferase family 4 protein [Desulfovibrio inopinatus]